MSIRLAIIGLVVALGLTALAGAAAIVIGRGDPISAPAPGDVPVELQPGSGARLSYGGQIEAITLLMGAPGTVTPALPLGYLNPSSLPPGSADAHPAR